MVPTSNNCQYFSLATDVRMLSFTDGEDTSTPVRVPQCTVLIFYKFVAPDIRLIRTFTPCILTTYYSSSREVIRTFIPLFAVSLVVCSNRDSYR